MVARGNRVTPFGEQPYTGRPHSSKHPRLNHYGLTYITFDRNDCPVSSPLIALLAAVAFLASAQLGGGLYEHRVLDPVWPHRPAIIQPRNGGVSRRRFWIPVHIALEVALIAAVVTSWNHPHVRAALLIALASHAAMRIWSFADFIPKATAFEKADPATIDRNAAVRWSRRSLLRLPLDAITSAATLTAMVAAA